MKDQDYMNLAIQLATGTIGQTAPNPSVGCVLVREGVIVGMGSHLIPGEGHAEVLAINQAGEKARGATAYVTLEPCSHTGKTPPCSRLLIESGVTRVVVATEDPNPLVSGRGINQLKDAGLDVTVGLMKQEAQEINQKFFHFMKENRPFVTLKAAMTLDGKTATKTGDSRWVTGKKAREHVHMMRARHDAILVGKGTVVKDNPSLTVRQPVYGKSPIRIILATDLDLPDYLTVFHDDQKTYVVCGQSAQVEAFLEKHPNVGVIQMTNDTLEIEEILTRLATLSIQSVYVEGGETVHKSFVASGLIDECHIYIAPKLLTGKDSYGVIGGASPEWMKDALMLSFDHVEKIGEDIFIKATKKMGD